MEQQQRQLHTNYIYQLPNVSVLRPMALTVGTTSQECHTKYRLGVGAAVVELPMILSNRRGPQAASYLSSSRVVVLELTTSTHDH